jgi:hypothetical protein
MSMASACISDRTFLASAFRRTTRSHNATISSATAGLGAAAADSLSCGVLQSKQTLPQQVSRVRLSCSHLIAVLGGIVDSSTHKAVLHYLMRRWPLAVVTA